MLKKINIFNGIAIILVAFSVLIDLIPNLYFDTSFKLFIYIFAVFLVFINMKIRNRKLENEGEKEKNRKEFLIIACIIYSILLITLLLIDGNYRRFGFGSNNNIRLFSKEHFELYSNFIPFTTIYDFINRIMEGTINTNIATTNIMGNIVAFAPFGIFIPILFKEKFSNIKNFIVLIIGIVFVVECVQFITLNGSFDVDDIILNVFGAILMYGLMKIKPIKKALKKILE